MCSPGVLILFHLIGATSSDEIIERITMYAGNHSRSEKPWIYGSGWELTMFPDANPSKTLLDHITSIDGRPALIISADGHSAWVNSRALELANITSSTPDPPHGRIERDPHTGEPSGTLRELAIALIEHIMPSWSAKEWQDAARDAIAKFNSVGITSLQDAGCNVEVLQAYNYLDSQGQLHATVVCSQYASPNKTVEDQVVRSTHFPRQQNVY
jgi:predicted amidohydrolase YtcJ